MRNWLFLLIFLLPCMAAAQTDDRSYLTAFLEDNLSDIGRQVTITGFAGALSSQATITSMTIADRDGVWLTLNGVALDWNRAALFNGRVSVNALTADEIIVTRRPIPDENRLPSPEASGFSLPELPVSVDIGRIAATRIVLEAPVFGSAVEGTFEASMALMDGEGRANLMLDRTDDGPEGQITLAASYSNASGQLILDLDATEAEGGIAAALLGLPGTPSASLTIKGSGQLNDFVADIALATDGTDRLAGSVVIRRTDDGATQFNADLGGDLAPLFLPDYAKFFGSDVRLTAIGARSAGGKVELSELALQTRVLALTGSLALAADGLPDRFGLNAILASPDGEPILLPFSGGTETLITGANLDLSFDAVVGDDWGIKGVIEGLVRPDLKIARLSLDGSGRINRGNTGALLDFTTRFGADGVAPRDAALAQALGPAITGFAAGSWAEGSGSLTLSTFDLTAGDVELSARGRIEGLATGLTVTGQATARIADLGRLSALAGRPLSGTAAASLGGTASILGGTFDLTAAVNGTNLRSGLAELDALLAGASRIDASVTRTETGTNLRSLTIRAASLNATASGTLASAGSDLAADLAFSDLSALGGQYRGALTARASLTGTLQSGSITLDGKGVDLAIGQPEADRVLRGTSTLSLKMGLADGTVQIAQADLSNPQLTLSAKSTGDTPSEIDLTAKLANLGILLPEFPGAVSVIGTVINAPDGVELQLRAQGPGQIDATVAGVVARTGATADLAINGKGQAALANAFMGRRAISGDLGFDLRLNGPMRLAALAGQVSLAGGRISSPDLPFSLQDTTLTATLSGGQAQLSGQAAVSTGGGATINGSFGLAAPNNADLSLSLRDVVLRDPELYETRASGNVTITGPLAGGAVVAGNIQLRDTELQVPSGGVGGTEPIPDLRHIAEPGTVRATRARAGLLAGPSGGGGQVDRRAYGLDLTISAPERVFLRGRGLDAELGGTLRLRGTTVIVIPEGGLNLIRGRLDILGKRLELSEAQLRLEGDFVPFIRVAASTVSDGVTSSVLIEGLVSDPVVSFTSSPSLPQEEVLSRLLFDRGLENLSAFQAAQLAGAVASLAGRGGDGIVARLRKGFGLDDLDVRTTEDGEASLSAGKYIARNLYSEIEVDQTGKSQILLNLDVTDSITLRGRAGSDGTTGLGIVLEKDY